MENENIYINDIFWDRIYLNIIFHAEKLKDKEIYLFHKNKPYLKLMLEAIGENEYKIVINITNVQNGQMLENGNYAIKILDGEDYINIPITNEVGYKIENLDKIYRYKNYYAYTINFGILEQENGEIACNIKSKFMVSNDMPISMKIKKALIRTAKVLFRAMYRTFDFIHFNKKNKVLLMSETRAPISGNLKALDDRIKERNINKEYKISYFFCKTLELGNFRTILKWIKLSWLISKQEIVFVDDYTPIFKYINLGKKTKLVQVWHAGVGFKSVGYARFGFNGPEPYESCHRKYDYAIVGAKSLIPVYSEVFGIDKEKLLPYGIPRMDNFLEAERINKVKEKLYSKYANLKGKSIILFAPTFRGSGQKKAYYPFEKLDLDKIFKLCEEKNSMFVMKMHPFITEHIEIPEKYSSRIVDLSDYKDINELLYITDILITDYSSTIYDFCVLNKPILFYTFDLEKYEIVNKVHRPIKEYAPGKVCCTFDELIKAIYNDDFEMEKLERYRKENVDEHETKASDLIIDNLILKGDKNNEEIIN